MNEIYRACLEDIEIAQGEMSNLNIFPKMKIIKWDFYAVPISDSHNHQCFYAVAYEEKGELILAYAKTYVKDVRIAYTMRDYSFRDCLHADRHPVYEGKILFGKASGSDLEHLLTKTCLPLEDNHFDGVKHWRFKDGMKLFRGYERGAVVKEVGYRHGACRALEKLYDEIEPIIL